MNNADFIIPVEIDGVVHQVRGRERLGVGEVGVCATPRYPPPILREPPSGALVDEACPKLKEGENPRLPSTAEMEADLQTGLLLVLSYGALFTPTARDPVQVIQDRLWCWPACSPLLGSGAGALQPWGERANLDSCIWIKPMWERE